MPRPREVSLFEENVVAKQSGYANKFADKNEAARRMSETLITKIKISEVLSL